eukprot:3696215-Pyramimonas_sp.AAC.1
MSGATRRHRSRTARLSTLGQRLLEFALDNLLELVPFRRPQESLQAHVLHGLGRKLDLDGGWLLGRSPRGISNE